MGKNICLTIILLFFIVADVTSATFFSNVRKLSAPSPKVDLNAKVSPIPSPISVENQTQLHTPVSTSGKDKSKEVKSNDEPVSNNTGLNPPTNAKEVNNSPPNAKEVDKSPPDAKEVNKSPPDAKEMNKSPPNAGEVNKSPEKTNEKEETKSNLPPGGNDSCDGLERRCQDTKSMVACIKDSNDASKSLVLFIQNGGGNNLRVGLTIPGSGKKNNVIDIPKHQNKKVDIPIDNGGTNEITLNAGHGDCVLELGAPTSQGNYFQWLPSYSKFMTPMYGAYLLILITVIIGGVATCCWFKKRKKRGDIPYQELEMNIPDSAAVTVEESAEGWDQGWDDDWDEEKAVRSPGGHNISANGLTSRTPNKDGWEDWDE